MLTVCHILFPRSNLQMHYQFKEVNGLKENLKLNTKTVHPDNNRDP